MRKLVSIKPVTALTPIEGADFIELAEVDHGWQCVVKKGEFKVGDNGVYFEIDSFVPGSDPRFAFLSKTMRNFEGNYGARIKTIRLKKQLSQGLLLPVMLFPECNNPDPEVDLAEALGVKHYELIVEEHISKGGRGRVSTFPSFIFKTDQERIQNLHNEVFIKNVDSLYEVTMKLDGSSMTVYYGPERAGVCSRNHDLVAYENDLDSDKTVNRVDWKTSNKFWATAIKEELLDKLTAYCQANNKHYALQGELMGPGVCGNREGFTELQFFLFDIFDIDNRCYLAPLERRRIAALLDIRHVPVLETDYCLRQHDKNHVLLMADGPSLVHPIREGIVFKRLDGQFSFKAVSNKFLLADKT